MMEELESKAENVEDNNVGDLGNVVIDETSDYQEIDKLESVGINVGDIKKLKAAGLYTLSSIVMATSATLQAIKGLSEAKVQKITECVKKVRSEERLTTLPTCYPSVWISSPPHHTHSPLLTADEHVRFHVCARSAREAQARRADQHWLHRRR